MPPEPTLLNKDPGNGKGDPTEAEALAAFRETIPEAYREDPSIAVIPNMEGLVKSYIAGQKIIGVPTDRLVTIPNKETADESDWNTFYDKLGRPEKGADYKLQAPKDMPEGVKVPDTTIEAVSSLFHKYGLTPGQAQGIWNDYNVISLSQMADGAKAQELVAANGIADLKKDWGAAWDAKTDTAGRDMKAFGSEDFRKWLDDTGLGDNPNMLRIFSSIGEKLMETQTDGDGGSGFRTLSPAEAQAEISQLQADETFTKAYTTQAHPGHKDAVEKMTRLFQYANPEDAQVT